MIKLKINFLTFRQQNYYDDLGCEHDSFEDHILRFINLVIEATRKYSLQFTKNIICSFAVQEMKLVGKILVEKGDGPDPELIQ